MARVKYWFRNPRRSWLLAVLACLVAPLSSGTTPAEATKDLVGRLDALGSFRADFTQRTYREDGTLLEDASGNFTFARPDRIRWEVEDPFPQVIVSNGLRAAVFDPDLEQLVIHEIRAHETSIREILGLGTAELAKRFEVAKEADTFTLLPVQPAELYSSLSLHFSAAVLIGITLDDKLGTVTEFGFMNMRPFGSTDPGHFLIDIPVGTDVVGNAEEFLRRQVDQEE